MQTSKWMANCARYMVFVCLHWIMFTNAHALSIVNNHLSFSEPNFLVLSDIHFDPYISCRGKAPCPLIKTLAHAPASEWPMILERMDKLPAQFRQDSNYPLLISSLKMSQEIAEIKQSRFVLVLGDLLGHDYKDFYRKYSGDWSETGYRQFVQKTYTFLNLLFANAFKDINVYFVLGNNDSYDEDYYFSPNNALFSDNAKIWGNLIYDKTLRQTMISQFQKNGYYALDLQHNLRLIVLNTNMFSYKTRGVNIKANAKLQLEWLHQQLETAKKMKQQVIIAMHIPPSIDIYATPSTRLFTLMRLWKKNYQEQFQQEIKDHEEIISAVFTGHLHSDWFHVNAPFGDHVTWLGNPSISPIFGNQPGFKLYAYNETSGKLEASVTYYYTMHDKGLWNRSYGFNLVYPSECQQCKQTKLSLAEVNYFFSYLNKLWLNEREVTNTAWQPAEVCEFNNAMVTLGDLRPHFCQD